MEETVQTSERRLLKVAITGPESTGKTTLAKALADYYNTVWVPEYARTYLQTLRRPYEEDDLVKIAEGQVALEKSLEGKANNILFCDTEMLVMKIWSEHRYSMCSPRILQLLETQKYDLYFLTGIDIPWEPDPLRENFCNREYFFNLYKSSLKKSGFKYNVLLGTSSKREEEAIVAISAL